MTDAPPSLSQMERSIIRWLRIAVARKQYCALEIRIESGVVTRAVMEDSLMPIGFMKKTEEMLKTA